MKRALTIWAVALFLGIFSPAIECGGEAISTPQETTEEGITRGQTDYVVNDIVFDGVDDAHLAGRLFVPDPDSSLRTGVVIYHGFGDSKENLFPIARRLAEEGYAVLAYDHRSHGESTGDLDWGKMVSDAQRAISLLMERSDVDRIATIGCSMGGMIAIRVSAHDPRVSAIISLSTPKSLSSVLPWMLKRIAGSAEDLLIEVTEVGRFLNINPTAREPLVIYNLHTNCRDLLDFACLDSFRFQPIDYVDNVDKILFLQGTADELINPKDVQEIYERALEPKKLIYIEGASHGLTQKELEEEISMYISEWIEICLLEEMPAPYP
jgi:pimeloyl-ACP methyl ester carboxylesterase